MSRSPRASEQPNDEARGGATRSLRNSRRSMLVSLAAVAAAIPALTVVRTVSAEPRGQQPPPEPTQVPPPPPSPDPMRPPTFPPQGTQPRPTLPARGVRQPLRLESAPRAARGAQLGASNLTIGENSSEPALIVQQDGTGIALQVTKTQTPLEFALRIDAAGAALGAVQTQEANTAVDVVDLVLKSTGDAVFAAHIGGKPPGYSGPAGGNSGFNVLIPQYRDDIFTGRGGSVLNDRTGMTGLVVESQAPNADVNGIRLFHWGQGAALAISNQFPGFPLGHGRGIFLAHNGNAEAVVIDHAGTGIQPTLSLITHDLMDRVVISAGTGDYPYARFAVTTLGRMHWGVGSVTPDVILSRAGAGFLQLQSSGVSQVGIIFGDTGDVFYRSLPGQFSATGQVVSRRASLSNFAFGTLAASDVQFRWLMQANGAMFWSGGAGSVDTNLYRAGADQLKTDDQFIAGSATVTGDLPGVANATTFTNVNSVGTANGAGVGTVKFADGANRDSAGFIKIKIGTTNYYIPVFASDGGNTGGSNAQRTTR
jgi:hypothetical protein